MNASKHKKNTKKSVEKIVIEVQRKKDMPFMLFEFLARF